MNKNLLLWIVIGMTMMSIFNMFSVPSGRTQPLSYTAFIEKVDQGLVDDVMIQDKKCIDANLAFERFKTADFKND